MTMHKLFRNNSYFNFLRFFSFPLSLPFSFKQFTVNQTFIKNRTLINNIIVKSVSIATYFGTCTIFLFRCISCFTILRNFVCAFVRIIAKVFPQISCLSHINIAAIQILNYKGYSLISFFKL